MTPGTQSQQQHEHPPIGAGLRLGLATIAVSLVAAAVAWVNRLPDYTTSAVSDLAEPPAGKLYHGVFPGGTDGTGGDITPEDVLGYQRAVGKRPVWVYFCNNWFQSRAFPYSTASWIRSNGSVPYIRLILSSDRGVPTPDPVYTLDNILAGKFDPDFARWLEDARRFGSPLVAEYGVEVNGWWFPWNGLYNKGSGSYAGSVAKFRSAYRHIIQMARDAGARNIRWVFHVDPWDEPVEEWNRFEHYYPGDDWIDWVGVSVYGRQVPKDRRAVSFRVQMDSAYRRLAKLANKPVIVCEFGTILDSGQAAWAKAALLDILGRRWPRVIGFSWWNADFENDSVTGRRSDMRVQDNPELLAVFQKYVGKERSVIGARVQ